MDFRQAFDPKTELALVISAKDQLPDWAQILGFNQGTKLVVKGPHDLNANQPLLKGKTCVLFMPRTPSSTSQSYAFFKSHHQIRELYFYLTQPRHLLHVHPERACLRRDDQVPVRVDQLSDLITCPIEHFSRRRFNRVNSTARAKILVARHEFYGQFVDFSGQGACLIMPGILREKTFIAIQYLGDGGRPVTMHCSVQWSQTTFAQEGALIENQCEFMMGIRFIGAA